MTKAEARKIIAAAFGAITHIQDGFYTVAERLQDMNAASEKQHRNGRAGFGLSVREAARLFTVRHLAEALEKPDRYSIDDILSIRTECLYAQAYAKKHAPEIRTSWLRAGVNMADILALDYADLV
jgi:hypothetical protein